VRIHVTETSGSRRRCGIVAGDGSYGSMCPRAPIACGHDPQIAAATSATETPGAQPFALRWRVPLALAALLVSLQAAHWRHALEYRRAAVLRGQLWRLVTGDVVHLGWAHLARDLGGLFLIWALVGDALDERSWLWVLGTSGLAVGLGLLAFSPELSWYVGISGVLFGLLCAGALCQLRQRPIFAGVLLLGMISVVAWTLSTGALPSETVGLGGKVVPQAHLYGVLGGAAVIIVRTVLRSHWLSDPASREAG
jgi:rhomboid family GlyGly-CTERM serine protease